MAAPKRSTSKPADRPEWTLKSPKGNEYIVTSPVDRYNLIAQGYADVDPAAAAKATEQTEAAASSQNLGPADAATAAAPGDGAK